MPPDRDITISPTDAAALASHDDDTKITDSDLGNDGSGEEDTQETETEVAVKKTTVKKVAAAKTEEKDEEEDEEEEDEEEEEEDEEEEEEEDPVAREREKLAKKLSRTARARTKLEEQVDDLRRQLDRQAEQRSEASQKRLEKLTEELDQLYESVEEFRADGKTKDASKAQRRIDEIRDSMTRSQATYQATREALQQTEVRAYNTMVKELETLDPRFDPDGDDYEEELLTDVNELVQGYERSGMPLTEALRKALKLTLREDIFAKGKSLARESKKTETALPAGKKKTDVVKNLAASNRQPPTEPGTRRERSQELPNMQTISEADFDALPESVQRKLLGSELA